MTNSSENLFLTKDHV